MENTAPLWKRTLAILVDMLVCMVILMILSSMMPDVRFLKKVSVWGKVVSLLMLTSFFIYFAVMEALRGQTLGKMLLKIKVVDVAGQPVGWGKSLGRNAMRYVDGIFMIGYLFVFFNPSRRRLGDLAAGTQVIDLKPAEEKKADDPAAVPAGGTGKK